MKSSLVIVAAVAFCATAVFAKPALVPMPKELVWVGGVCPATAPITETTDMSIPREGYRLEVATNGITIVSSSSAGAFYARQTLKQLEERYEGRAEYRCCRITDSPAYSWRAMLVDEGRHFFGKETVKSIIDLAAQHKFNTLHWHLTEDQGWRIDVPGMPELVKYGSVRPESPKYGAVLRHHGGYNYESERNGEKYGPFYYTRKDLEEVVAYAAARQLTIVPEIELPGHSLGAIAAYPELTCQPENIVTRMADSDWGVSTNVLCVGNDNTLRFLERVLDYVCEVFPSKVIHIGGDECPRIMWERCPKCQARMRAEGLKTAGELQGWITSKMADYLAKKGRRIMGWDEILAGKVPQSAIGQSWRTQRHNGAGTELVSAAGGATKGHDMVISPHTECYYDYSADLKNDPYQYIGGHIPLERAYRFDPAKGIPEELRSRILGSEACIWGEYIWNRYDYEWKAWPRACALAEVLWTNPVKRDFAEFRERVGRHRDKLVAAKVNCQPVEGVSGKTPFPEFSEPRAVTGGEHDHFLANYFAINAWSPDNRYLLVLETDIKDTLPDGRSCTLGLVDLKDGNRFIPVTTTRCWNFQEAAMAHWLPWAKDTFVFNDVRNGKFCAVVMNWKTKTEKCYPFPVSAVSEDGEWAVSINYARLFLTRPDYGYAGDGQDPRKGVVFPEDDGLWRLNLRTGEAKLIVSTAAVKDMVPKVGPTGMSYLCHTVISKDFKRIYFLSRSVEQSMEGVKKFKGVNWFTTAFTCRADGSEIRRCFPDGWGSSHFNWKPNLSERDARTMVVTCKWLNEVYTHVEFTVGEEQLPRQIGGAAMHFDGHCIYSPDGEFVSGDGYFDNQTFTRHWKIVRLSDMAVRKVGDFFVPEPYRDIYCRCDLHPRWRPDGRQIGFNSVHEGTRQVYVMDVEK